MEKKLLHILQHSLGVDEYGRGEQYRNHFAVDPGSEDFSLCEKLVEMGLMKDMGCREMWGGLHWFIVTEKGIYAVVVESPAAPTKVFDVQTCRVCGCTNDDCSGCIERTGKPCYWVEEDLCSACADTRQPYYYFPIGKVGGKRLNNDTNS
jgi:hypothetical protein